MAISALAGVLVSFKIWGVVVASSWIGSGAFAISGLPQAIRSYKQKHSHGVANGLLGLWLVGEVFTLIYGIGIWQIPIIFNCITNAIFIAVVIYYKIKPQS